MVNVRQAALLLLFISFSCFLSYKIDRIDFLHVIFCYGTLFLLYYIIIKEKIPLEIIIATAVISRASLLFSFPNLSDDIYRFVWDGQLTASGINPYLYLPTQLNAQEIMGGQGALLLSKMNSPNYYSVYPPISQFLFGAAAMMGGSNLLSNVIALKVIYLIFDILSIVLILRLLKKLHLPARNLSIYALNPLAIIEVAGNAHLEGVLVFFVICSFYFLSSKKLLHAGISLASAICIKLLPLLFTAAILKSMKKRTGVLFLILISVTSILLFIPFHNLQIFSNILSSVELYFHTFEFNASIYYLVREAGSVFFGYNIIETAGILLGLTALALIFFYQFKAKISNVSDLILICYFSLLIYFLFSTTIHPWYLVTFTGLSCFVPYKSALIWSAMIVLSYFTYSSIPYNESMLLLALEYSVVFLFLAYELVWRRKFQ